MSILLPRKEGVFSGGRYVEVQSKEEMQSFHQRGPDVSRKEGGTRHCGVEGRLR